MDKHKQIRREINRLIRGVNWRMRCLRFFRGLNDVWVGFFYSTLILIKICNCLLFVFLEFSLLHFIFKFW